MSTSKRCCFSLFSPIFHEFAMSYRNPFCCWSNPSSFQHLLPLLFLWCFVFVFVCFGVNSLKWERIQRRPQDNLSEVFFFLLSGLWRSFWSSRGRQELWMELEFIIPSGRTASRPEPCAPTMVGVFLYLWTITEVIKAIKQHPYASVWIGNSYQERWSVLNLFHKP